MIKDIPNYEFIYGATENGDIYSYPKKYLKPKKDLDDNKGKFLKPALTHPGYLAIYLTKNGDKKTLLVHRLIAKTFIPNPNNLPFVNHKNGIKTDNRVINLEWCTREQNEMHALSVGLKPSGENCGASKLKESEVLIIREMAYQGHTHKHIASKFNVIRSTISCIISGKTWKEI